MHSALSRLLDYLPGMPGPWHEDARDVLRETAAKNRRIQDLERAVREYNAMEVALIDSGIEVVRDDAPPTAFDPLGHIGFKVIIHG
jgi:hypothetical protein